VKRFWWWGLSAQLAVVVAASIGAYAGVLPTSVHALPHLDWLGHAVGFGLLAFFLDGALGHRPLARGLAFPRLAPALVLAIAGAEELAQGLSPRRSSSLGDFIADLVGVCLFAWLAKRVTEARSPVFSSS
jgi:VanZ family protein